jgi:hypothetical protein
LVATIWLTEAKSRAPRWVTAVKPSWLQIRPNTGTKQRGGNQKAKLALVAEQREGDANEQPDPQPRDGPGQRDLAACQAPGDALDRLEFGTDNGNVLHGEAAIGQVIDHPLRLRVRVVDARATSGNPGSARREDCSAASP